jgi:uncharacterized membrane protein YkgB
VNRRIERVLAGYDHKAIKWMQEHGLKFLRWSVAMVFIWFGALKVVGHSPASELVASTVPWADPSWFVPFLGWWEVAIGICFLYRPLIRVGLLLLAPQMVGTFLPLILLPGTVYTANILTPSLEGQYIIKNLVIIGSAMVIGAHADDRKEVA